MLNNTSWDGRRPGNAPTDPQIPGYTQYGDNFLSELPQIGSTEVWEIVNLTRDAHPIHLHLVQFQLINRHAFNVTAYRKKYDSLFPGGTYNGVTYPPGVFIPAFGPPLDYFSTPKLGGNPDVTPYLQGRITLPNPEEIGWKDTLKMFPGEVTRIAVRWAPQDILVGSETPGTWQYGFDPTVANGALDSTGAAAPQPPGYVWHCHIVDHEDNEMMRPYIPRNIAPLGAAGQDTYLPIVEKE
jgi:FtsP/CotA-like multicopper oxidase with cupredoxin domain